MSRESDKAPDTGKESEQPRTRGGASGDDRSKGMGTEQSGPFDAPQKDTSESKEEA